MGTGKEACSGAGSRDARVQVLRARPLEGRSSRWLHPLVLSGCLHLVVGVGMGGVVECNHRMTRAGPLNQCFSNCTVTRTHLRSGDSESVGLGYRQDSMF